jgi:hypothetical protein
MQKASGEGCVDLVEEFEKEQTDTISVGKEPITVYRPDRPSLQTEGVEVAVVRADINHPI